jgi:cephalosporin-C deacetylase-like acetyl esterase
MKMLGISFLAFMSCQVAFGQVAQSPDPVKLFAYDNTLPLDVQEKSVVVRDGVRVRDITYASPKGGRVPAFVVEPIAQRHYAGVVFLPWTQGNRSSFLPEGILLAQAGAVSVMIDPPSVRPEPWRARGGFDIPEIEQEGHIQAVVDVRRAVDLLVARPDVDPARLAYVGHSYGASLGGAVALSETRFKTLILMAGFPSWTETFRALDTVKSVPKDKLDKWLEFIAPLDALNYIGRAAPASLFFQYARQDESVGEQAAKEYFNAASSPKTLNWYDSGHEFNDISALRDRAEWLRKQVGIQDLRPILRKKIEAP